MIDLPTGTVTFLFTDIEGSTRLWEQHPEAMRKALARHDALLTAGIQQHGGHVVKSRGEGDSLFAVFARATDAVAAACALQQALFAEPWPAEASLQVRVALHTGEAELRAGDYVGAAVNRCARLRAAAHGGQTLVSLATQELVRDHLLPGESLRDLGEHRLKDLARPERIFQLQYPNLPTAFPPLASLNTLPNNLPQQVTSFIGRESEMAEVRRLLLTTRLLTLTGSGGTGKTRVALQVAADLLEGEGDGVWLVELAPLADPALVLQAVATALDIREEPGKPLIQTLVDFLKPKQLLVLLDNCEHLLAACAQLAAALLRHCPRLRIMVTSREGLGITGETTYRIPSLALPARDLVLPVDTLRQFEAVQLFVDRATAVLPSFGLSNRNAPAVAQVCHRLDGIPLALELAAAPISALPIERIAARLDDRFRLLTRGSRTALPRQQTLRAAIDWSYDLLSEKEQVLLRRLSVFAGGWTLEAAEAIGAGHGIDEREVLNLLIQLVNKSLVAYEAQAPRPRYSLLETVRLYARDRLLEGREADVLRSRHRDWFLDLAEEPRPEGKLDRLEREHDNLRAALEWSAQQGEVEIGLRLGAALGQFWYHRGHLAEGWERLAELLAVAVSPSATETAVRARALTTGAVLAGTSGDLAAAELLARESLDLWRELGDLLEIAGSLSLLADMALCRRDLDAARSLYEESLTIRRQAGSLEEIASSLLGLGQIARFQKKLAEARMFSEESLALGRRREDQSIVAYSLLHIGHVALLQQDLGMAASLARESLIIWREQRHKVGMVRSLEILALQAAAHGSLKRMVRLFGAAEALREAMHLPLPPVDRGDYESVPAARDSLGEAGFAAWAEGRAMSLDQAVAYALEEP